MLKGLIAISSFGLAFWGKGSPRWLTVVMASANTEEDILNFQVWFGQIYLQKQLLPWKLWDYSDWFWISFKLWPGLTGLYILAPRIQFLSQSCISLLPKSKYCSVGTSVALFSVCRSIGSPLWASNAVAHCKRVAVSRCLLRPSLHTMSSFVEYSCLFLSIGSICLHQFNSKSRIIAKTT